MMTLSLIGIGCGDPGQLTRAAIGAINAADLVLIPRKGTAKSDLADLRRTICADVLTNDTTRIAEFDLPVRDAGEADYRKGVDDWHDAVAATWSQTIADHLGGDGKVALLIWGIPRSMTFRCASRDGSIRCLISRSCPASPRSRRCARRMRCRSTTSASRFW